MKILQTRRGAVAWVTAGALLLAACGASAEESDQAAPAGAEAGREAAAPDEVCTRKGGDVEPEFVTAFSQNPTSLDPDRMTNLSGTLIYLEPVYASLLAVGENAELLPELAESWSVSEDGDVLELDLIRDYEFHDGTPFDAAAVKANIERSRDLPGSFHATTLQVVQDVVVVDEHTVQLVTDGVAGSLAGVVATAAGFMMSPAVMDDPEQATLPTGGSGPFRVASYRPSQEIVYEAYDGYFEPDVPRVERLTIRIINDETGRLNAILSGEIDQGGIRSGNEDAATTAGLVVCRPDTGSLITMPLNSARGKRLGNPDVRRAINLAVDRGAMNESQSGLCKPSAQLFDSTHWAHNEDLQPEYDPDEARALLEQSGEDELALTITYTNAPLYQAMAEIVQQNLQAVGFTVDLVGMEYGQLLEEFSVKRSLDAIVFPEEITPEPSVVVDLYLPGSGFSNPGGATSPEIDSLLQEGKRESDEGARARIYQEVSKAAQDLPWVNVPLCWLRRPSALKPQVTGFEQSAIGGGVIFDHIGLRVEE